MEMVLEENLDKTAERNEFFFDVPFCFNTDKVDKVLFNLFVNLSCYLCVAIPCIVFTNSHIVGVLHYICLYVFLFERFALGLHFATHRKVANHVLINSLPHLVTPFFGIPCGLYRMHHILIHHKNGNEDPADISSTEMYQRDNWFHLFLYCFRFLFWSLLEIPWTMLQQQGLYEAFKASLLIFVQVFLLYYCAMVNFVFFLWIFFLPAVTSPVLLAWGNWCQHIFIDQTQPSSPYSITYNVISSKMNQRTFNDGYHICHHLSPACHWYDLPLLFESKLQEHIDNRSLIFINSSFLHVGYCVMTQNYDELDNHFIFLADTNLTKKEREELLRERLRPVFRWKNGTKVQ